LIAWAAPFAVVTVVTRPQHRRCIIRPAPIGDLGSAPLLLKTAFSMLF
jgi:hypothetical protein